PQNQSPRPPATPAATGSPPTHHETPQHPPSSTDTHPPYPDPPAPPTHPPPDPTPTTPTPTTTPKNHPTPTPQPRGQGRRAGRARWPSSRRSRTSGGPLGQGLMGMPSDGSCVGSVHCVNLLGGGERLAAKLVAVLAGCYPGPADRVGGRESRGGQEAVWKGGRPCCQCCRSTSEQLESYQGGRSPGGRIEPPSYFRSARVPLPRRLLVDSPLEQL